MEFVMGGKLQVKCMRMELDVGVVHGCYCHSAVVVVDDDAG